VQRRHVVIVHGCVVRGAAERELSSRDSVRNAADRCTKIGVLMPDTFRVRAVIDGVVPPCRGRAGGQSGNPPPPTPLIPTVLNEVQLYRCVRWADAQPTQDDVALDTVLVRHEEVG
jgi:hypothetical protein